MQVYSKKKVEAYSSRDTHYYVEYNLGELNPSTQSLRVVANKPTLVKNKAIEALVEQLGVDAKVIKVTLVTRLN